MSLDGFQFEGRDMTAADVRALMPAYQRTALGKFQSGLEAGIQTVAGMVAHIETVNYANLRQSYMAGKTGRERYAGNKARAKA